MLYGLLVTLFTITCFLLMLIILIQKGKGSMGLGGLGGGTQLLFGGSGGQELFQKITWVLGTLFLAGSFILAIVKTHHRLEAFTPEAETQAISHGGPMGNRLPAPTQPEQPAQETPANN